MRRPHKPREGTSGGWGIFRLRKRRWGVLQFEGELVGKNAESRMKPTKESSVISWKMTRGDGRDKGKVRWNRAVSVKNEARQDVRTSETGSRLDSGERVKRFPGSAQRPGEAREGCKEMGE